MTYGNEFEAGIGYEWIPSEKTAAGKGEKKLVKCKNRVAGTPRLEHL